jgi:hypothetical protein
MFGLLIHTLETAWERVVLVTVTRWATREADWVIADAIVVEKLTSKGCVRNEELEMGVAACV